MLLSVLTLAYSIEWLIKRELLQSPPFMQITRTEVLYWKVDEPKHFSVGSFPVFKGSGGSGERDDMFYGIPALEYPGLLKVQCLLPPYCINA